jgi:hypothetical protein
MTGYVSHQLFNGNGPGGHDGSGQARKAWGPLLAGLVPEREHAKWLALATGPGAAGPLAGI